ncbi:hypothetical protein DY000_02010216 [Brassica cretica]|uniref:Fatty acid desaturase domain-containing protein n=1 Tax=Brassica cretica TaxID=69181 RepID=A0ABQ7BZT3_BRACR|nr:hypothetical protein DY000_02010216 [Brassica cretica]
MAVGWPLIIYKVGILGWVKFWLMPWMGYHFWMSTFTMVHHTAPHIPFKPAEEWNAAQAQLNGTVHCDYPSWIEILCHDINVHIPHHISPRIPSYNLRAAHESIQENWGKLKDLDYIHPPHSQLILHTIELLYSHDSSSSSTDRSRLDHVLVPGNK